MSPTLLVSEIYGPVIQGEGMVAGQPTVFVRLGGCDFHCSWCDSLYAVEVKYKGQWSKLTAGQIMEQVGKLVKRPILITLSGGNPALQDCSELIELGHKLGYTFAIETQGTKCPDWVLMLDSITISPKPPSSGMITDWVLLKRWLDQSRDMYEPKGLKVVIFDDIDFEYAGRIAEIAEQYNIPMYVQAGTDSPYMDTSNEDLLNQFRGHILRKTNWLGDKVIAAGWYNVRVLPQIHALLHGAKRGV